MLHMHLGTHICECGCAQTYERYWTLTEMAQQLLLERSLGWGIVIGNFSLILIV
jgi:hypothetical protein